MFFFGPKKDKYYDIAQKLFTSLADAAQPEWKNRILIQRDLMKRAKRANEDSALALSFKSLPDDARIMPKHPQVLEVPFASVRLSKDGKEFFADISVSPDGAIGTIQFTQHYLAENGFDVLGVDFFPNLFNAPYLGSPKQEKPFRISEKLVSILGADWDRELPPVEIDDPEEDYGRQTYAPALPPEIREEFARLIHTKLPDDWQEFSRHFSHASYHGALDVYGYCDEMQIIPLAPCETAWYLVARVRNEMSSTFESYILASSDPAMQDSLYFLTEHDGGESDLIPIGTDLFGFLRKADDEDFLDSLKKK